MRKLLILPILAALVLVGASPAVAKTRNVKVADDYFVRNSGTPTVTVKKGVIVKWNFRGRDQHNVVVSSGPASFQSPLKSSGSFKRKMKKRGTYRIICTIHQPDMRMTLRVK
jgi:plastocyanin